MVNINEKSEDYLGMQWQQLAGKDPRIVINMDAYIDKLILVDVPKNAKDTQRLTDAQYHDFLSGLGQVRWPLNHLMPTKAYDVSSVSQHGREELKVLHLKGSNSIIKAVINASTCNLEAN